MGRRTTDLSAECALSKKSCLHDDVDDKDPSIAGSFEPPTAPKDKGVTPSLVDLPISISLTCPLPSSSSLRQRSINILPPPIWVIVCLLVVETEDAAAFVQSRRQFGRTSS